MHKQITHLLTVVLFIAVLLPQVSAKDEATTPSLRTHVSLDRVRSVAETDQIASKLDDDSAGWRPYRMNLAPARWIWLPSQRTLPNTFVLFRKEIELKEKPLEAAGWITADSRYRLTVNGQRVQWGPAPCDPRNLDVDRVDITPFLKKGKKRDRRGSPLLRTRRRHMAGRQTGHDLQFDSRV